MPAFTYLHGHCSPMYVGLVVQPLCPINDEARGTDYQSVLHLCMFLCCILVELKFDLQGLPLSGTVSILPENCHDNFLPTPKCAILPLKSNGSLPKSARCVWSQDRDKSERLRWQSTSFPAQSILRRISTGTSLLIDRSSSSFPTTSGCAENLRPNERSALPSTKPTNFLGGSDF